MGSPRSVVKRPGPGPAPGAFSMPPFGGIAKGNVMGLFVIIAILGAAWLVLTA